MIVLGLAILVTPQKSTEAFLASLTDAQRKAAVFAFESDERMNWAFVPRERKGVSLKDLDETQRKKQSALLKDLLDTGYPKAEGVRALEEILRGREGSHRDPNYYVTAIFGEPGEGKWGLRYEGHHLSLNYVFNKGKIVSSTPQFVGANPADGRTGPNKNLLLSDEEGLARSFVDSLSPTDRAKAIVPGRAPADILTGNSRSPRRLEDQGLLCSQVDEESKQLLRTLIQSHAAIQRKDVQQARMKSVDWKTLTFAWIGSIKPGEGHYDRIQCSAFLIEYDNTQNGANHIHTVWRDFKNDFGGDPLAEHYRHEHRH